MYFGFLELGDIILVMDLIYGGYLIYGVFVLYMGKVFNFICYCMKGLDGIIDIDDICWFVK